MHNQYGASVEAEAGVQQNSVELDYELDTGASITELIDMYGYRGAMELIDAQVAQIEAEHPEPSLIEKTREGIDEIALDIQTSYIAHGGDSSLANILFHGVGGLLQDMNHPSLALDSWGNSVKDAPIGYVNFLAGSSSMAIAKLVGDQDMVNYEYERSMDGLESAAIGTFNAISMGRSRVLTGGVPVAKKGGLSSLKDSIDYISYGVKPYNQAKEYGRFLNSGFTPMQAKYLSEPYPLTGMGSHFIPKRSALYKSSPTWLSESSFNVVRPNVSRGAFYEYHFAVDSRYFGSAIARKGGAGSWSGKRIGLETLPLPAKVWYGMPTRTKVAIAGTSGAIAYGSYSSIRSGKVGPN